MLRKTYVPSPSHYIPLQQPSPASSEPLEPPPIRGYTSYTNLSPSPSPSKGSLWSIDSTSTYHSPQRNQISQTTFTPSPYSQPAGQAQASTSTITDRSMSTSTGTNTPPASPSTIRTVTSVSSVQTPTKKIMFAPVAPSPLSVPLAGESPRRGSETHDTTGLGKKRSSSQLLAGLGKGLGRMGSVVRRTASDGSAQPPNAPAPSAGAVRSVSASAASFGSGRSKRGWKPKLRDRKDSLQEEDEDQAEARAQAQSQVHTSRSEGGMDMGDEGIGLPFNVEVSRDGLVSPGDSAETFNSTTFTSRLLWKIYLLHGWKH